MTFSDIGLPSDLLLWKAGILTIASFAIGILGGLIGLALGTMRLPTLLLMGVSSPVAAGTNIIVSSASSITGAITHYRAGRMDPWLVVVMGVPSFAGAFAGGFYSQLIAESLLIFTVGILVLWQGIELLARANRQIRPASPGVISTNSIESTWTTRLKIQHVSIVSTIGLIIGIVGGAVGLILGSLRIPALIRILDVDPRIAAGTNMAIGALMGATGWIGHIVHGQVDYPLMTVLAASAMAGVSLGSKYTGRLSERRLVMTMGLVMISIGVILMGRVILY